MMDLIPKQTFALSNPKQINFQIDGLPDGLFRMTTVGDWFWANASFREKMKTINETNVDYIFHLDALDRRVTPAIRRHHANEKRLQYGSWLNDYVPGPGPDEKDYLIKMIGTSDEELFPYLHQALVQPLIFVPDLSDAIKIRLLDVLQPWDGEWIAENDFKFYG